MSNFLLVGQDYQVWPKFFQIFCPQRHIPYWDRLLWDTFLSLSSISSNPNRLPPSLSKKQDWLDLKIIMNDSWIVNRESWIITWFIFCNLSGVFPMVALQPHAEFITLQNRNIMTHLTQLPSDKNPMQDSNSFQQIVRFPFSSSILLLFACQSIQSRLFPVVVLKNKNSVYILFRN